MSKYFQIDWKVNIKNNLSPAYKYVTNIFNKSSDINSYI